MAAFDVDTRTLLSDFLKNLRKRPRTVPVYGRTANIQNLKISKNSSLYVGLTMHRLNGPNIRRSPPRPDPLRTREQTLSSFFPYILSSTTAAYYKLLKTQRDSFHDLRGVHPALEILANRVSRDSRTRALVDDVRREAGARRTVWLEESETGSGEG
ncbi:hypothetical protein BGY98DRAFT_1095398 [Russula aff. rugulosa BPL654]|nr:hypothetical protein BGY98DRAFT_1095398 [Russula aff. rugulosa BPL654]